MRLRRIKASGLAVFVAIWAFALIRRTVGIGWVGTLLLLFVVGTVVGVIGVRWESRTRRRRPPRRDR